MSRWSWALRLLGPGRQLLTIQTHLELGGDVTRRKTLGAGYDHDGDGVLGYSELTGLAAEAASSTAASPSSQASSVAH